MYCWIFYDVNSEHLGQTESFPTIDAAVGWLQKQAEDDLPDVDVDADIARLVVVTPVKIQRKVQLIGLPELVAVGAVSPPAESAPAAAPSPRRGRKLVAVPAPADIADQVPQSEPEPAVTELVGVMAGDAVVTDAAAAALIDAGVRLSRDIGAAIDPAAVSGIVDCVKDHLLKSGTPATEAQLIARIHAKLTTNGIDVPMMLDALTENGTMLAAGIEWCVADGAVTYSLKQPESAPDAAPEPAATPPQTPWEIVNHGCVVELRVGDVWSHQIYQQPAAASTVAERLRGHMESGATGPASVAQRFMPGRAPSAPEL